MKARLPKGYGAGPNNMQGVIKQAQKMQEDMEVKQAEIDAMEFTSSTGGGVVNITVNGKKELVSLKLKEEIVDKEDIEMLEDLIVAAMNEALRKVEDYTSEAMGSITSGMPLPGVF